MKVVTIGAGPAGILLANYLLNRSKYKVEIYEKLHAPRLDNINLERTFPLALLEIGLFFSQ